VDLYDILLFLHVTGVIFWFGSGMVFQSLVERAARTRQPEHVRTIMNMSQTLGNAFYIVATLGVLASGIWMTLEGEWGFDEPFVIGGLTGFVASSVIGGALLGPTGQRLEKTYAEDPSANPGSDLIRLRNLGRIDALIMLTVVFLMTVKPGT
jgi:uncharacterized membrane protein